MSADDHILNVMEALEEAGVGPLPLQQVRTLTQSLIKRFPEIDVVALPPEQKPRAHWKRWSETEDEQLREMFCDQRLPTDEIAERLGRSKGSILGAVSRLQLRRGGNSEE